MISHPALWYSVAFALGIWLGDKGGQVSLFGGLGIFCLGIFCFRQILWVTAIALGLGFLAHRVEIAKYQLPHFPTESQPEALWFEGTGKLHRPNTPSRSLQDQTWIFTTHSLEIPQLGYNFQGRRSFKLFFSNGEVPNSLHNFGIYQISGYLKDFPPPQNPHQLNLQFNARIQGFAGLMEARSWHFLHAEPLHLLQKLREQGVLAREWIRSTLTDSIRREPPRESDLILAMVLGTYPADDPFLQEAFTHSGTLHLFSVSGLHVAIIAWVCLKFFKLLPFSRITAPSLTILICFFYAFLTGWSSASVRAALMITVVLSSGLLQRRGNLLNSLGISALLILIWDPQQLFHPGFQLSFTVMLGLGLLESRSQFFIYSLSSPDPFIPRIFLSRSQRFVWKFKSKFLQLFSSSGAAFLSSTPLTLYYFNLLTPISLLANFILIPLSILILWISSFSILSHALGATALGNLCNACNYIVSKACLSSAEWFSSIPGGHFYPSSFSNSAGVRVLSLPRGESSLHIYTSTRNHYLLDTGSIHSFPFVLSPYLKGEGVDQLEAVYISHRDQGHAGALPLLQKAFRIRNTNLFPISHQDWTPIGSTSDLELFLIKKWEPSYPTRNQDDASSIFQWQLHGFTFLYMGDSGFLTEKNLLRAFPEEAFTCDVLIRSQHRSDFSASSEFLRKVKPRILITGDSDFPPQEQLSEELLKTCRDLSIEVWNLQKEGAITLQIQKNCLNVTGFKSTRKSKLTR